MIHEARQYIESMVMEVDDAFERHKEANTGDNIGASRFDKTYWIDFALIAIDVDSNIIQNSIQSTLDLSIRGGVDPIEAHDELWCKAVAIRDNLITRVNIKQADFQDVSVDSIDKVPIDSNENWTKLRLSITILLTQTMR